MELSNGTAQHLLSKTNNTEFKMQIRTHNEPSQMVSSHNSPNGSPQQSIPSPNATEQQHVTPHSSGHTTVLNSVSFPISHDSSQQTLPSNNDVHGLLPQISLSQSPTFDSSPQNGQFSNFAHGLPQIAPSQSPTFDSSQPNVQFNNFIHGIVQQIAPPHSPHLACPQQMPLSNSPVLSGPQQMPLSNSPVLSGPQQMPLSNSPVLSSPQQMPLSNSPVLSGPQQMPLSNSPVLSGPQQMPLSNSPVLSGPQQMPLSNSPVLSGPQQMPLSNSPVLSGPQQMPLSNSPVLSGPQQMPLSNSPILSGPQQMPLSNSPVLSGPQQMPLSNSPVLSGPQQMPLSNSPVLSGPQQMPLSNSLVFSGPQQMPLSNSPVLSGPQQMPLSNSPVLSGPQQMPLSNSPVLSGPQQMPLSNSPVLSSPQQMPLSNSPVLSGPQQMPLSNSPVLSGPQQMPLSNSPVLSGPQQIPLSNSPVFSGPQQMPLSNSPVFSGPQQMPLSNSPVLSGPQQMPLSNSLVFSGPQQMPLSNSPVLSGPQQMPLSNSPVLSGPQQMPLSNSPVLSGPQQMSLSNSPVLSSSQQIPLSNSPVLSGSQQMPLSNSPVLSGSQQMPLSNSPVLSGSQQMPLSNSPVLSGSQQMPLSNSPILSGPQQMPLSNSPVLSGSQQMPLSNSPVLSGSQQMPLSNSPVLSGSQQMNASNSSPPLSSSKQSPPPSQSYSSPEHNVLPNFSTQPCIQQSATVYSCNSKQFSVYHPVACPPQLPAISMSPLVSLPEITLANSSVLNSSAPTNSTMSFPPNSSSSLSQIGLNHLSDTSLLQYNDHQSQSYNIFVPNTCPSSETTPFPYVKPPPDYYIARSTQNQFLDGTENGGMHIALPHPLPLVHTSTFAPEYLRQQQPMTDLSMGSSHTFQMGEQSFMPNFNLPKFYNFVQPGIEMQSSQQPHKLPLSQEHHETRCEQPQRQQVRDLQLQQLRGIQDIHLEEDVQNEEKRKNALTVKAILLRNIPGNPTPPSQTKLLGQLANAVGGQENASHNGFNYAIQEPPFVTTEQTCLVPTSFAVSGKEPSGYSYPAAEMSVPTQIASTSVTPPLQRLEITPRQKESASSTTAAPWMAEQKGHLEILLQDNKEQHSTNIKPSTSAQAENFVVPTVAPPVQGRQRRRHKSPELEQRKYKPCVVCSDQSSGYHYNVSACEGCKGFFRRSIQRQSVYICHRNNACEITKGSRTHCQSCRLQRCLKMGMSRDAVRGDRSKRSIDQYADKLRPDQRELLKSILNAHRQTATPVKNALLNERLRDDRSKDPLYDKVWEFSIESAQNILEFFKKIPGFSDLCIPDRVHFAKGAAVEIMIFRLCRRYNPLKDTLHLSNNSVVTRENFREARLGGIVSAIFDFAKQLHSYNLDEAEFAVLCALSFYSIEIGRLIEPKKADYWQDKLIDLFLDYIHIRRAGSQSFTKILHVLTTIRGLGVQYSCTIKSVASIRRNTMEDESLVFQLLDKPENLDVTYT